MKRAAGPGLRERKKAQTRERIHKVGLELFERQGFDATTVAQIADAADVAPRTVFQQYPTKGDIVFGDVDGAVQAFDSALRSRPPGTTTFQVVRAWINHAASGWLEPDIELQTRLAAEVPSIAQRKIQIVERFRGPLAGSIATDLATTTADLRVQLAASAAITALLQIESLVGDRIRAGGTMPSAKQIEDTLDQAQRFIDAGVGALDPPSR